MESPLISHALTEQVHGPAIKHPYLPKPPCFSSKRRPSMWAQLSSAAAAVSSEISPLDPESKLDQGIRAALRSLGMQQLHGRPSCLAALSRPRELPKCIAAGDACPANQAFRTQAPVCPSKSLTLRLGVLLQLAHHVGGLLLHDILLGAPHLHMPKQCFQWCDNVLLCQFSRPTLVHQTCPASKHQRLQSQATPCLLTLLRPVLSSTGLTSETRCSTVGKPGLPYASSGG